MKTSPCPNCGGKNLYRTTVESGGARGPNFLPGLGSFWVSGKFDVVVCRDCGLSRFFAGREATEKLAQSKKWKHVDGSA
jgi:predicted nucleic-acid-binding Zn-ribbon protein